MCLAYMYKLKMTLKVLTMQDDFGSELKDVYETYMYQDDLDKDLLQPQVLTLEVSSELQAAGRIWQKCHST